MKIYRLALLFLTVFLLTSCSSKTDEPTLELTISELSNYDGQDGEPAYVAIDGLIYDVSNIPEWQTGTHNGYGAGNDLTDFIDKAPHGRDILEGLVPIGTLIS